MIELFGGLNGYLKHEHMRADRDDFISVDTSNIPWWRAGDYAANSYPWGDYNYQSLMHYGNTGDSIDGNPVLLVNGCTGTSGSNSDGVSCQLGGSSVNDADAAAAMRVNHGQHPASFRLRNRSTNECLRPSYGTSIPMIGNDVYTSSSCSSSSTSRRWYVHKQPDGTEVLINKGGRVCLRANGTDVNLANCVGADTEFKLVLLSNGYYQVRHGSNCLRDNGSSVWLSSCISGRSRQWKLEP